jgi:hypothetical protein
METGHQILQMLAQLLASMKDDDGRVTIKGL